jgi:uncharacterized membrane protein (DUF2068 family)
VSAVNQVSGCQDFASYCVRVAVVRPSSRPLALAAVLVAVEAAAAIVFGASAAMSTHRNRVFVGAGTAVLMAGYGALLASAAWGLWRGRRWSRGPTIATQLIQLPVAWSFVGGQTTWLALLLGTVSVLTLICLLVPSSTAVFAGSAPRSPEL